LISGNWKMNYTHLESIAVIQKLAFSLPRQVPDKVQVSVHPPFTSLRSVQTVIDADDIDISLGAQDCYWEEKGAYTGEISPIMLAKLNVSYVIVGHSERRQLMGETDVTVRRKLEAVLRAGMTPIVCVGEAFEVRHAGGQDEWCRAQLESAIDGLAPEAVAGLVVAYEPIWAIGTGENATAEDAQAMAAFLRAVVAEHAGSDAAARVRVQYGGSVKSSNIAQFMAQPDVDGALVGGASLDPEDFAKIIAF
jgi:triosephosphate isomerase